MGVRVATNLTLPPELVAEIDVVAGRRGRSAFVEDAVRRSLRREKLRRVIDRQVGAWNGEGPPEWSSDDGVATWVRALRTEPTQGSDGA